MSRFGLAPRTTTYGSSNQATAACSSPNTQTLVPLRFAAFSLMRVMRAGGTTEAILSLWERLEAAS